jgi:hypothetical protein
MALCRTSAFILALDTSADAKVIHVQAALSPKCGHLCCAHLE